MELVPCHDPLSGLRGVGAGLSREYRINNIMWSGATEELVTILLLIVSVDSIPDLGSLHVIWMDWDVSPFDISNWLFVLVE